MNKDNFDKMMHSVDDDLLEEAAAPRRKNTRALRIAVGALAACFCVSAGVLFFTSALRKGSGQTAVQSEQTVAQSGQTAAQNTAAGTTAAVANPVHETTADALTKLGYTLPLPSDAKDAVYSTIDQTASSDQTGNAAGSTAQNAPIAQVTFTRDGKEYTCRALKASAVTDISGIFADWTENLDWTAGKLLLQLRRSTTDSLSWFGWFSQDDDMQWCLSWNDADSLSLMHTAQQIVDTLGYEMEVAPDGAKDIAYQAFTLDKLTVAETTFTMDGISYAYRTASTSDVSKDFADISGTGKDYAVSEDGKVSYCPARIYYNADGSGKIVWFDVVPGLLYSLSMDHGASSSALKTMAEKLFVPAQGDVGSIAAPASECAAVTETADRYHVFSC